MVSSRSSEVNFECSLLARVNQHITNCDSIDAIYESHKSLKFSVNNAVSLHIRALPFNSFSSERV